MGLNRKNCKNHKELQKQNKNATLIGPLGLRIHANCESASQMYWAQFEAPYIIIHSIHLNHDYSNHVLTSCTSLIPCLLRACSLWSYLLQILRFPTAASIHPFPLPRRYECICFFSDSQHYAILIPCLCDALFIFLSRLF